MLIVFAKKVKYILLKLNLPVRLIQPEVKFSLLDNRRCWGNSLIQFFFMKLLNIYKLHSLFYLMIGHVLLNNPLIFWAIMESPQV